MDKINMKTLNKIYQNKWQKREEEKNGTIFKAICGYGQDKRNTK